MSEQRPQHTREPAEGSDEEVEPPGLSAPRLSELGKLKRGHTELSSPRRTLRSRPKVARRA